MTESTATAATLASRFINHTHCHIFLTGKAGTGKTTFLRNIVQHTHKKTVIAAPTGIAAINAGGVTLHSLFQLPFGCFMPEKQTQPQPHVRVTDPFSLIRNQQMNENKRKLLREMELLIIDEVSMLRADLLDAIDAVLRHVRRRPNISFGGVQVLFIGDLLQLPPVVKDDEWNILRNYYSSIFFFNARVLQQDKPLYVELDKIYRQSDETFINLLNHLRNNTVTREDIQLLQKYHRPGFTPQPTDNHIILTTHNNKADSINRQMLNDLTANAVVYRAEIKGDFPEGIFPVEEKMELKEGAQVMFVKNDQTGAQRFFNGKIATVKTVNKHKVEVVFNDTGKTMEVDKYEWENTRYALNETTNEIEEETAGTFTQYPLKLAWAITVHKSQGLTFDKAVVDIGNAFAPGQVYVALSRLRSLEGLVLASPVNERALLTDEQVRLFSKTKDTQGDLETKIEKESLFFLKDFLLQVFDFSILVSGLKTHMTTYNEEKDAKRSAKQKYASRMMQLLVDIENIKTPADKFMSQVSAIMHNKEEGFLPTLQQRTTAAKNYFSPLLWQQSAAVITLLEEVKNEKKVNTYIKELLDIESRIYEQIKLISRAVDMVNAMTEKREFNKSALTPNEGSTNRLIRIENALRKTVEEDDEDDGEETKPKKRARKTKEKKPKEPKAPKPDTKLESLRLYKEGKNIDEIAAERNFSASTIEGHLSYFISKKELSVLDFMSEEQFDRISRQLKNSGKFELGILKGIFGDEFSYGQLRMAVAGYLAKED